MVFRNCFRDLGVRIAKLNGVFRKKKFEKFEFEYGSLENKVQNSLDLTLDTDVIVKNIDRLFDNYDKLILKYSKNELSYIANRAREKSEIIKNAYYMPLINGRCKMRMMKEYKEYSNIGAKLGFLNIKLNHYLLKLDGKAA